jgi:lambda repressor-like predicted transcriptional regulator
VVLAAVRQNGHALEFASDDLKLDREVVLAALEQNGVALKHSGWANGLNFHLIDDREVVLTAVRQRGWALGYALTDMIGDRAIVLAAVEQNGMALQFAAIILRHDRRMVVLAAVLQDGRALQFADTSPVYEPLPPSDNPLKADKELVLAAVRQNGLALAYAADALRADGEVVLAAVRQNGHALRHASVQGQQDWHKVVFLAAVGQTGGSVVHIAPNAVDDEIALAAVTQDGKSLEALPAHYLSDLNMALAAARQHPYAILFASDDLWGTDFEQLVEAAVSPNDNPPIELDFPGLYRYAPYRALGADHRLHVLLAANNGGSLGLMPVEVRGQPSVVMAAVTHSGMALEFASVRLKSDRDVLMAAVRSDGLALAWAGARVQTFPDVVLAAVKNNGLALRFAPAAFPDHRATVLAALAQNGLALRYASEGLREDRAVVLVAVRSDGLALNFAAPQLWSDRGIVFHAVLQNEIMKPPVPVRPRVPRSGAGLDLTHPDMLDKNSEMFNEMQGTVAHSDEPEDVDELEHVALRHPEDYTMEAYKMLNTYPLLVSGLATDPFLQEIARAGVSILAHDAHRWAQRRLAVTTLLMPDAAPALSPDLIDQVCRRVHRQAAATELEFEAAARQSAVAQFEAAAAATGGFLHPEVVARAEALRAQQARRERQRLQAEAEAPGER